MFTHRKMDGYGFMDIPIVILSRKARPVLLKQNQVKLYILKLVST